MDLLTLAVAKRFRDLSLSRKVLARFLYADGGEEESSEKGGVPARWGEWLKAVHEGGKRRVPNPTPGGRKEVAFSTALKNKQFFQKALKEYREWAAKQDEKESPKGKGEGKPEESPKENAASNKEPSKTDQRVEKEKSGTKLPSSIPEQHVKRIFGDKPPSVEDFQEMFSIGEGYTTKVNSVSYKEAKGGSDFSNDMEADSIEVSFHIKDKSGKVIVSGKRNFNSGENGPEVYLQEVTIDEAHQGKGIGKDLVRKSFEGYAKMGVKRLTLDAAYVGRYAWARMGFEPDEKVFKTLKDRFKKYLVQEAEMGRSEADKVLESVASMKDLASVKVGGNHVGKDYLLHKDTYTYEAHLDLSPDSKGYQTAKAYVGL